MPTGTDTTCGGGGIGVAQPAKRSTKSRMDGLISHQELRRILSYDPATGEFVWLVKTCHKVVAGRRAGAFQSAGYWCVGIGGHLYLAHRLAWFYVHGKWPHEIDHINQVRTDNRLCNLREVTRAENNQNIFKASKQNLAGFLGVHFDKKKFIAQIGVNRKCINLGAFATPEEAHQRYLQAKRKLHPAAVFTDAAPSESQSTR